MDLITNLQTTQQARFSLENAKLKSLNARPQNHENKEDLMKTARQFEGIFMKQLFDAMDKTVDRSDSILSGGSGEDMFRGMMYDKISESMASRPGGSGMGLAEAIYRQLEKRIPKTSKNEPTEVAE